MGWAAQVRTLFISIFLRRRTTAKTPYTLTVKDVPVDAFWSVIVYDSESWIPKNTRDIYSYNDITAKKAADGSITIHFGGDPKADNYLEIMDGLELPREAVSAEAGDPGRKLGPSRVRRRPSELGKR